MTVAELIQELQKIPPHKEAYLPTTLVDESGEEYAGDDYELGRVDYNGAYVLLEPR